MSDAEYSAVKQRCTREGLLSVSDFIRAAVLDALGHTEKAISDSVELKVTQLRRRIHKLEARFAELSGTEQSGRQAVSVFRRPTGNSGFGGERDDD